MDDLVSAQEIADALGLSHAANVHAWIRRYRDKPLPFPAPIKTFSERPADAAKKKQGRSGFHVWAWPDVVAWVRATGRGHLLEETSDS